MGIAAICAVVAAMVWRWGRGRWKVFARAIAFVLAVVAVLALGVSFYLAWWFLGRSSAQERMLFEGVEYRRVVSSEPVKFVAHLVVVDLRAAGLSFVVTPDEAGGSVKAATVGEFLKRNDVQVALNANFFDPFHSNSPWDYYPKAGDAVRVLGVAASRGEVYSTQVWADATVYLSESNRVQIGGRVEKIWNAIAGDQWLVRGGTNVAKADRFGRYARAGIGLNAAGDRLILAAVDGKQPGYSEGVTLPEFAELMKRYGAREAVNLDGGGSVTLVAQSENGGMEVLNSPIHTRIPGRQRPVANHLGIRAGRVK